VLLLGIEQGLAIGIAVSLASVALRAARPHVAVLGRLRGSEHFRNVRRHDVETWSNLLLIRVDESLNFANASFLESTIATELAERHDLQHVVLVMSSVNAIDSTALESLERLAMSVREAGVTLHLSDVKGPVMDRLKRAHIEKWLDNGRVFLSAHQAVETLTTTSLRPSPQGGEGA
jgi:SulP family sulfate permease